MPLVLRGNEQGVRAVRSQASHPGRRPPRCSKAEVKEQRGGGSHGQAKGSNGKCSHVSCSKSSRVFQRGSSACGAGSGNRRGPASAQRGEELENCRLFLTEGRFRQRLIRNGHVDELENRARVFGQHVLFKPVAKTRGGHKPTFRGVRLAPDFSIACVAEYPNPYCRLQIDELDWGLFKHGRSFDAPA